MEIKIDWNKDRCKWNIYTEEFGNEICVDIISTIPPSFRRWIEGGQHKGAVFFEGSVWFESTENGKVAYIDATLPD